MDLEGTLVNGGINLPGSVELIEFLNKSSIPYYIITNTVSKTVLQMEENLKKIGLNVLEGNIIGGKEMGIETIMVKTGKYQEGDEIKYKPNKVINNLKEIIKMIQK
jgi:ribonucleotide monophosphatase NagD (HAD superfamily)